MSFLRESKWTYGTAANGGVGVEFVMAAGGAIWLLDPQKGEHRFWYGGVGVGLSTPKVKIPHVPLRSLPPIAGRSVTVGGAAAAFPSTGIVYMTPGFAGQELAEDDFRGGTLFLDGAAALGMGIGVAAGATAMLLGMDPLLLALGLSSPAMSLILSRVIMTAPAVLVMGGVGAGITGSNIGIGGGVLVGYVH